MARDDVELRHDALRRRLTHRERNVGAAQAEVGKLAIAHAMELGLGGAQPEVRLHGSDGAPDQAAQPHVPSIMKIARA